MNITELLTNNPVVPLVQADDPAVAVETSRALAAGGLKVAEVVFRTDRALECLRAVADEVPEMIAGAGTVLSAEQANAALDNGAQFIVSPGLDDGVVGVAQERGVPIEEISGQAFELWDVRRPDERALAHIEGSRLLDDDAAQRLAAMDRDTVLVFHCHHGGRSQKAAEHFAALGFRRVANVAGGIDAWSQEIDPAVPRY